MKAKKKRERVESGRNKALKVELICKAEEARGKSGVAGISIAEYVRSSLAVASDRRFSEDPRAGILTGEIFRIDAKKKVRRVAFDSRRGGVFTLMEKSNRNTRRVNSFQEEKLAEKSRRTEGEEGGGVVKPQPPWTPEIFILMVDIARILVTVETLRVRNSGRYHAPRREYTI